jgi:hypothetical protein
MIGLESISSVITATGGLGTASFGLVDATKALWGGPNHFGFAGIEAAVRPLIPPNLGPSNAVRGLPPEKIVATLRANWFNGIELANQKAIAKSLIKLNLGTGNAEDVAKATGVDGNILTIIAGNMVSGKSLESGPADVLARFDLVVTALLDEAYQRADRAYVNGTRVLAMLVSLALALVGGLVLHDHDPTSAEAPFLWTSDMLEALVVGLLATPLAPIAKDLSTALATAVNAMQAVKK